MDTGSDNTILPKSVADYLGIAVQPDAGPPASVFGGFRVQLLVGEATLKLEADSESVIWKTSVRFFDFPAEEEESVILGHAGFLDYFTAIFDGKLGTLELVSNDELPDIGSP